MRRLTIFRRFFTASDCYKAGVRQTMTGVQVHSTGANNPYLHRYVGPDDGRLGPNKYGNHSNRPGSTVCASAYIGKLADGTVAVYQALPWDMRCWLSGSGDKGNANKQGFVGFEICEDDLTDKQYFAQAMEAAVHLTAHLCKLGGFDIYQVRDHAELHRMGLASGHADIGHWLKRYGYTMDDFRAWVQTALDDGVEVTYVDADAPDQPPEPGNTGTIRANNGGYVNIRDQPGGRSTAMIRPGSRCETGERRDGWTHVTVAGWVKDDYIE